MGRSEPTFSDSRLARSVECIGFDFIENYFPEYFFKDKAAETMHVGLTVMIRND